MSRNYTGFYMKIERLILSRYKRVRLNNIDYFEIEMQSSHQIILGTNGSGKSAIMSELSPLPGSKSDYFADGYKEIHISHENSNYVLKSGYEKSKFVHSFLKDDVELNEGHTQPVQLELVKVEFGITPNIFELISGQAKWTQMNANTRREWMTLFGGGDMRFALKVFNSVKRKHNEAKTLVKHYQERIGQESTQLISNEKIEHLTKVCYQLKVELATLIEQKEPGLPNLDPVKAKIKQLSDELSEQARLCVDHPVVIPQELIEVNSIAELESLLNQRMGEAQIHKKQKEVYQQEYTKVKDIVQSLKDNNVNSLSQLGDTITELESQLSKLDSEYSDNAYRTDDRSFIDQATAVKQPLINIIQTLPDNRGGKFSRVNREKAENKIDAYRLKLDKLSGLMGVVQHKIDHHNQAVGTVCPKCKHAFKIGSDESIEELSSAYKAYDDEYDQFNKKLEESNNWLEAYRGYIGSYKSMVGYLRNNTKLAPLQELITSWDPITSSPSDLISVLSQWYRDIEVSAKQIVIREKIAVNRLALDHARDIISKDDDNAESKMTDLKTQMEDCIELYENATGKIDRAQVTLSSLKDAFSLKESMDETHERLKKGLDVLVRVVARDSIQKEIIDRQSELAVKETELNSVDARLAMIKDLEQQLVKATEKRDILKVLENELSPIDGIIADQSRLFIDSFILEVNRVISSVWEHSLEVQSCNIESNELTYRFPLIVGSEGLETPDISKCSSGQQDMLDYAFRIVSVFYLGLVNYPLYLDELAPTLDEAHQNNMMRYVKTFVETKQCSQLFMISHYASAHGIFPYADFCVTDSSNIINLPSSYNQHVTIR